VEEIFSDKIDEINDRLALLAVEGRWEAFNIPCQGEYLPAPPNVQVRALPRRRTAPRRPRRCRCPPALAARRALIGKRA
jgi:hypothetical protein